jgi:hypothetical protein
MLNRLYNLIQFQIERFIIRGPAHRFLIIIAAIGLISAGAGLFVHYDLRHFSSPGEAIWWAFLRLADPGYLGDDQGVSLRVVSTALTVTGYVVLLGALVAIVTQWLNATLNRLQSGLTPIAQSGHIIILGWSRRTPMIVRELLMSEGHVRRFLIRRRAGGRLRIVILAEEVNPEQVQDLKDILGSYWSPKQIIFRSGNPLLIEHLKRVDALNASAIMMPSGDLTGAEAEDPDVRAIKVMMTIQQLSRDRPPDQLPRMVTELQDARRENIARQAYGGQMELLSGDLIISRLILQSIRHPGLSVIYNELLVRSEGHEFYVRECPQLKGVVWSEVGRYFRKVIPLGLVQRDAAGYHATLNPQPDAVISENDRIDLDFFPGSMKKNVRKNSNAMILLRETLT